MANQSVLDLALANVKSTDRVVYPSKEYDVVVTRESHTGDLVADNEAGGVAAFPEVPKLDGAVVAATCKHVAVEGWAGSSFCRGFAALVRDIKRVDDIFVALERSHPAEVDRVPSRQRTVSAARVQTRWLP